MTRLDWSGRSPARPSRTSWLWAWPVWTVWCWAATPGRYSTTRGSARTAATTPTPCLSAHVRSNSSLVMTAAVSTWRSGKLLIFSLEHPPPSCYQMWRTNGLWWQLWRGPLSHVDSEHWLQQPHGPHRSLGDPQPHAEGLTSRIDIFGEENISFHQFAKIIQVKCFH